MKKKSSKLAKAIFFTKAHFSSKRTSKSLDKFREECGISLIALLYQFQDLSVPHCHFWMCRLVNAWQGNTVEASLNTEVLSICFLATNRYERTTACRRLHLKNLYLSWLVINCIWIQAAYTTE